jgi:hypothetical protein
LLGQTLELRHLKNDSGKRVPVAAVEAQAAQSSQAPQVIWQPTLIFMIEISKDEIPL